jgi:hypothetical protein
MADNLISDKSISFGITDTATLGFFESLEYEEVHDKIEVKDGDGDIIGIDYHSKRYTVTGTFVMDTGQSIPTVGGSIAVTAGDRQMAIGSNNIYVDTVKESHSNSDVIKVEFTGTTYPSIA